MYDMQIRNPVVCDASKVSLYKKITTICLPARKEQVGIYHNQIFTKINKLFTAFQRCDQETIKIIDPTKIPLKINKVILNSPGSYYKAVKNKLCYSPKAQETITIIGPARIDLKNKLSYFSIAQETIKITAPARIPLK